MKATMQMNSAKVSAIDRLIGIIWKLNYRYRHILKTTFDFSEHLLEKTQ